MATGLQLTQEDVERIAAEVEKAKAKTKTVDGVKLPPSSFAWVGDEQKTATWKLPIDFPGDEEKTKTHIRNALARFSSTQGIPDDKKAEVKAKIVAAAKKHGIDVDDEGNTKGVREFIAEVQKRAEGKFEKGLWAVGRLADVLQTLAWLYDDAIIEREIEGDDSDVPDDLKGILENLVEIFIASATEEARELAAKKADINKGGSTMTPEEQKQQEEALLKAAKKSLATHFAKSAVHHEKMAKAHETAAESHGTMQDACKADVGESSSELHKAQAAHHGVMKSFHEKCAKADEARADHFHKMAESHDKEEAEKTVKAERGTDPAPVQKTEPAGFSIDAEIAQGFEAFKKTDAFKDLIAKRVSDEVQKALGSTMAPDGTKVSDGVKLADASGLRVVQRSSDDSFKLAGTAAPAGDAGI